MSELLKSLIFLGLISSGLCLDFGNLLGLRREGREDLSKVPEAAEVVETVRWRQSVCVVPGPNVPSCYTTLKKYESKKKSAEGLDWPAKEKDHKKTIKTGSLERDESDVREILTPKVTRLMEIHNLPSVELESSEGHGPLNIRSATPGLEVAQGRRDGKYLIIDAAEPSPSANTLPPVISVTKVLNSPVTATLVAKNCFPDIGVPLCENYQETLTIYRKPEHRDRHVNHHHSHHRPHHRQDFYDREDERISFMKSTKILLDKIKEMSVPSSRSTKNNSSIIIQTLLKPQVITIPEAHQIEVTSTTPRSNFISTFISEHRPNVFGSNFSMNFFNKNNETNRPGIPQALAQSIQAAGSFLFDNVKETAVQVMAGAVNQSQVVVVDKEPEIKPIVVLEHTPKPGLFANVWAPGPFNMFNKINVYEPTNDKPANNEDDEGDADSELSTLPTIGSSMETKISQVLDQPDDEYFENDNSNDNNTEAQSDQPSPIADDLPKNSTESDSDKKTDQKNKNIFGLGSLFPTFQNKPLVIERPGQPPLLIEKPIYVAEKLPFSYFFNFIRPSDNQTLLNVDHEVIKEPVYVFEKLQSPSRFFHNFFGNSSKPVLFQGWFSTTHFSWSGIKKNVTTVTKTNNTVDVEIRTSTDIIDLTKTVTSEPTEIEKTEKPSVKVIEVFGDAIAEFTEVEPEKVAEIQVSTTPETTSTIVEKKVTVSPEFSGIPEVVDVVEEEKEFIPEIEISKEPETTFLIVTEEIDTTTATIPTIPEVQEVFEVFEKTETTFMLAEEIESTTTPEVSAVPEFVKVMEDEVVPGIEISNKTETTSIPDEQIVTDRPEVPTVPEFQDSATTLATSEDTSIPEVVEITEETTETFPTVDVSETPEPASTVANEIVSDATETIPEVKAIEEDLEIIPGV